MSNFEKIYTRHYNTCRRVATKLLGTSNVVSDIIQEVFISLYERRKDAVIIKQPAAWLYRATYYKCIDFLKQQNRFSELAVLSEAIDESQSFEQQEVYSNLLRALNTLKDNERLLAVLYSEGLSYKELADATGIHPNSIGKTLSRTLRKLEKELKKEYNEML